MNPNKTINKFTDPVRKNTKKEKQRNIDPTHALHDMSSDVDPLNFNIFSDILFGDPHIDDGKIRLFKRPARGGIKVGGKDTVVVEIKGDS